MRRTCWQMACAVVIGLFVPAAAQPQEIAKFYEDNCAPCHSIGGGGQVGPDLKGMLDRRDRQWLVKFLLHPEAVIKSGDPYATELVAKWNGVVMPVPEGMRRKTAEELIEFIDRQSRHATAATPAAQPVAAPFTDADRAQGRALFDGAVKLTKGGPSCAACHALGGADGAGRAAFGPDLTAVFTRLGGATGLTGWLARPPTPVMRALFAGGSVTEAESRSLAALFESTATAAAPAPSSFFTQRRSLLGGGVGGAIAGLAVIGLAGRRRFRSVRGRLVAAARRGSER